MTPEEKIEWRNYVIKDLIEHANFETAKEIYRGVLIGLIDKLMERGFIVKPSKDTAASVLGKTVVDQGKRIEELEEKLEGARLRLLSAAGDDLCRLSQEEIKQLTSGEVQIPPKEVFLESCGRFHEQIAKGPGVLHNCFTLAQLIAENEKLRRELAVERS